MTIVRRAIGIFRGRSGLATVAQTGFATMLILLLNVVTGVLSARFLGPQGRGELAALLLCPQMLCFLFAFAQSQSVVVLSRKDPAKERALMGAALTLSAVGGTLAVIAGVILIPRLIGHYSPQIQLEARWLLVFAFLGVMQSVPLAALQLRDRFTLYNRARIWQTAGVVLSLALLLVAGSFRPLPAALAYLLPTVPFLVWNTWWLLRELRPSLHGFRARAKELISFGTRLHLLDVGNTLFGYVDKLILVTLLSPALFGTWVVLFNLSRMITTFGAAVIPVLLPRAAGKPVDDMLETTSRALVATTVLNLLAVAGFVLFGKVVLWVLYGARFTSGYTVLVILSCEAALAGVVAVLQQPYLMMARPGVVAVAHLVSLAVGGGLMYALGARFGSEGAAIGLLCATALRIVLTYCGFRYLLGVRPPSFVPRRNDWQGLALLHGRGRGAG